MCIFLFSFSGREEAKLMFMNACSSTARTGLRVSALDYVVCVNCALRMLFFSRWEVFKGKIFYEERERCIYLPLVYRKSFWLFRSLQ